jgi:hypothetical protein
MSKKKAKKAAKPAPKQAAKKAGKTGPPRARARAAAPAPAARGRTSTATIFIFEAGGQTRVRTAPAILTGGPGHLEWTVVNLTANDNVPVEITWGPEGGPWGHDPLPINGSLRKSLNGSREGHFKYTVTAGTAFEDPEIEIPQN